MKWQQRMRSTAVANPKLAALCFFAGFAALLSGAFAVAERDGTSEGLQTASVAATHDGTTGRPGTVGTSLDESPDSTPQSASETCTARRERYRNGGFGPEVMLVAAFSSTAEAVAEEDERVRGADFRSSFRARPPSEWVAVCYFEAADFGLAARGGPVPHGDDTMRVQEVVSGDGAPYVIRAGRPQDVPAVAIDGATR